MEYTLNADFINNVNSELIKQLTHITNYKHYELPIAIDGLKKIDFTLPEKELLKPYNLLIQPLETKLKNKPCVYSFNIDKGNVEEILEVYKASKKTNKSALKNNPNSNTKCLYVGRSKNNIQHRLRVHLGYRNTTEKGLQLLHWAQGLGVQITVEIYVFSKELHFLLPFYEAKLQEKLQPLIGFK